MPVIIDNKTAKFFPGAFTYIGYFSIFIGIVLLLKNQISGVILIVLGILLGFSFVGILIDTTNKVYKNYSSFFGIKRGIWKSYNDLSDISILKINQKQKSHSLTGLEFKSKSTIYRVLMVDKSHREKILLQEFKTNEEAVKFAKELSEKMNKPISPYSPVISESSKIKR